jgi:hypothetical protein
MRWDEWRVFHIGIVCLQATGPQPLPERFLQAGRGCDSSFKLQYGLFSLRSSSRGLHLLPHLFVPLLSFNSDFQKQFLHNMWPIQLAFLNFIVCRMVLSSLTLCNRPTSFFLTWSAQLILSILLQHHLHKTSKVYLIYLPKCPNFSTIQSYFPNAANLVVHISNIYLRIRN